MADTSIEHILAQLKNHEERLRALESTTGGTAPAPKGGKKQLTLPEVVKGKDFKSGQEKIAVIVGYYEKTLGTTPVTATSVKEGWRLGKFDGKYNPNLLARAIKDGFVRNIDENLDLTQTGEKFWEAFLKSDAGSN